LRLSFIDSPTSFVLAISDANAALVTFGLYSLIVLGLAILSHRLLSSRSFLAEYFLGSRSLGVWPFMFTFAATSASAGSFAGFPSLIYAHGWVLALWIAGYMMVPLIGMGLLAKRLNRMARQSGSITLPELMYSRFGHGSVAVVATTLIVFLLTFYLVPQFKIASIILQSLMADVPIWHQSALLLGAMTSTIPYLNQADPGYLLGLLSFSIMVIAYTSLGGFRAVVWTDVLQGIVMFTGVIIMLVLVLQQVGGLSKATNTLAKMTPPVLCDATFSRTEKTATEPILIPSESWFELDDSEGKPKRLFRINEIARILEKKNDSKPVKCVEILSQYERDLFQSWKEKKKAVIVPANVLAKVSNEKPYQHGAGQTGVYVSAPGPNFNDVNGFLPIAVAISFFMYWAIGGAGQPGSMVRLMAFDSVKTLKRALALLVIYFGVIYVSLVLIFCCSRVLIPGLDQTPDRIMPLLSMHLASTAGIPWLGGLLMAAPFAAAMSTVDSFMLMISSSLVRDIYQRGFNPDVSEKTVKRLSYFCTVAIGVIVMFAAVNSPKFLQILIVFTGGGLSSAFLIPIFYAMYWPRFNNTAAIASMLAGFFSYLSLYAAGVYIHQAAKPYLLLSQDPFLWGLVVSAAVGYFVCKATPPAPLGIQKKFFGRGQQAAQ